MTELFVTSMNFIPVFKLFYFELTSGIFCRDWAPVAKFCARKLPAITDVIAVHNGKVVFRRYKADGLPGLVSFLKDNCASFPTMH